MDTLFTRMRSLDELESLTALREYLVEAMQEEDIPASGKAALSRQFREVTERLKALAPSTDEKAAKVIDIKQKFKAL